MASIESQINKTLENLLNPNKKVSNKLVNDLKSIILLGSIPTIEIANIIVDINLKNRDYIKNDNFKQLLQHCTRILEANKYNIDCTPESPLKLFELAKSVYVVYTQSRNGAGTNFSNSKLTNLSAYYRQMDRLFDVADRFNGVSIITNFDAFHLLDKDSPFTKQGKMFEWLNKDYTMVYCDPSYLKCNLNNECDNYSKKRCPYINKNNILLIGNIASNLGKCYDESFTCDLHFKFLTLIQNIKCKMLVSNYDNALYNEMLTPQLGWNKMEIETTTSVANGIKDNKRIEVLYYND